MTETKKHNCTELPRLKNLVLYSNLVQFHADSGWILDLDEYKIHGVKYCPFCGAKL